jgi:bifunctional oligoribonuclease and PAP phosphatase NrnA
MVIQEKTDIQTIVGTARRVLVLAKDNPGHDEGASALALFLWLKRQGKERVDIYFPESATHRFHALPGASDARNTIQAADQFIIQINVAKTKAKELSYDLKGSILEIKIKPEGGNFTQKDVSFAESLFGYDLIIVVGAAELGALGDVFEKNRELFFNTPIINIDRQTRNVRFGQVNAINLNSTSLAEMVYVLIGPEVTPDIAQCLLTGIIAATNSFQTPQVTPETLKLASDLIVAGAKQQEIVNHLYRTKDLAKLKVWGRVLSRLQQIDKRIVYSDLKKEDIEGGNIDLPGLVDDLVLASPEADVVLFFFEQSATETIVYGYARDNYDLQILLQPFKPTGNRKEVSCIFNGDRAAAETALLTHVNEQLRLIQR